MISYLASPYSNGDLEKRFEQVCEANAWLFQRGLYAHSPIMHWHQAAERFKIKTDAQTWLGYNRETIKVSQNVIFLLIDGWKDSTGMKKEYKLAKKLDKGMFVLRKTNTGWILTPVSVVLEYENEKESFETTHS